MPDDDDELLFDAPETPEANQTRQIVASAERIALLQAAERRWKRQLSDLYGLDLTKEENWVTVREEIRAARLSREFWRDTRSKGFIAVLTAAAGIAVAWFVKQMSK